MRKYELRELTRLLRKYYDYILGIKEGTDKKSTIEGIKKDIGFRGPTAWILIFSILIASIGLNVNSPAVIIGAMLISPLMGPILGIGLSVGIHDQETLVRSMKNLGIAVSISLITSTVYFMATPLTGVHSELLSRTKPTILDVLVAMFGGFAGIIAGSRREKSNVIPGVAIATALMPPLCTAGYGLATLNLKYFLGAFYLFFINSVFISLSTFLVVKWLNFPVIAFIDPIKQKRYKAFILAFLVITIIPSALIFYGVIQETRFNYSADKFIAENCEFDGSELISSKVQYADTLSRIDLYYIGKAIDKDQILELNNLLDEYGLTSNRRFPLTKKTVIRIHQEEQDYTEIESRFAQMNSDLRIKLLEDIYTKNEEVLQNKDARIDLLENEVFRLTHQEKDTIPFAQIRKELKHHFERVNKIAFSRTMETELFPMERDTLRLQVDTIPTLLVNYHRGLSRGFKNSQNKEIEDWLKIRLDEKKIRVVEY